MKRKDKKIVTQLSQLVKKAEQKKKYYKKIGSKNSLQCINKQKNQIASFLKNI